MIPPTIHFIWMFAGSHLSERHIFSLQSAVYNTTCKVVLHTDDPDAPDISGVEIRKCKFERTINNVSYEDACNSKMIGGGHRISHIKDIIRLDILYKEGGIYSDLDVIWLRNPYEYWNEKVVVGFTNQAYKILCNAVIMSEPGREELLTYKKYLVDMYPCKKYWIPANPFPVWKECKDVLMVKKAVFYPINYNQEFDEKKMIGSVAIHLFDSFGRNISTPLFDLMKKDFARRC